MISAVQILGIRFFDGDIETVLDLMSRDGGVLIAPSGTCFARLRYDVAYREAVQRADLALPDSGAMVILWRWLRRKKLTRISGLQYLSRLGARIAATKHGRVLWIVPNERAKVKLEQWLGRRGIPFTPAELYVAPVYGPNVEDPELVARIQALRPDHVVLGIGSGPQEKLGPYLRDHLEVRPAIHCVGAALGFLTGDQVAIPDWADRLFVGWLFRLLSNPRVFLPRLVNALPLPWLIIKYGAEMPPLAGS